MAEPKWRYFTIRGRYRIRPMRGKTSAAKKMLRAGETPSRLMEIEHRTQGGYRRTANYAKRRQVTKMLGETMR